MNQGLGSKITISLLNNFKWNSGFKCGAQSVELCNDFDCTSPLVSDYITPHHMEVKANPLTGKLELKIDIDLSKSFKQDIYVKGYANDKKVHQVYKVLVEVSGTSASNI
jgi:hypothetical protein